MKDSIIKIEEDIDGKDGKDIKREGHPKRENLKISFIVCTYNIEFFSDTIQCINSLINQNYDNKEIILVMDENNDLYNMFIKSLPRYVSIIVNKTPGLSEARNLGIKNVNGDIVVFIDDDAVADKNYISYLIRNYDDKKIIGVTGKIFPKGRPNYPEELYWIGGFTNKGFPEQRCEVRNGYGCNMSFRRYVFDSAGSFDTGFGRAGKKLVTCEDTEFSIRALRYFAGSKIIYDPSVIVYHKVHEYRQNFRYVVKRGYYEGLSKAHIKTLYNGKTLHNGEKGDTLSTENDYLKFLLAKAIPGRIENIFTGRDIAHNIRDIALLLTVMTTVGFGYIIGIINEKRMIK